MMKFRVVFWFSARLVLRFPTQTDQYRQPTGVLMRRAAKRVVPLRVLMLSNYRDFQLVETCAGKVTPK